MTTMIASLLPTDADIADRMLTLRRMRERRTYLYGAGHQAQETGKFLQELQISPQGHVVDPDYHTTNTLDVTRFVAANNDCNYVVAHFIDPLEATTKLLRDGAHPRNIFVVDCKRWELFNSLTRDTILHSECRFTALYSRLADRLSRDSLIAFLHAKLLYDPHPLRNVLSYPQYFPIDLPAFKPRPAEVFVDCGAYNGDTFLELLGMLGGPLRAYHAFEPDPENARQLKSTLERHAHTNTAIVEAAALDTNTTLPVSSIGGTTSALSNQGSITLPCRTIDSCDIPATFIKMDVEGAEVAALKGAAQTIATYRPKIAVAIYHNPDHLLEVFELINRLVKRYRFYLRSHCWYSEELILYAEPT